MDLISRQAAIDAAECIVEHHAITPYKTMAAAMEHLKRILNGMPSAQPERKKGKWVYNSPVTMKCDQCGFVIKDWDWHRFKICPNCGADMRGGQDE